MPNSFPNRKVVVSLVAFCTAALFLSLRATPQQVTATAPFTYPLVKTATSCAALGSGGSASCSAAPAGFVAIPASATTTTLAVDTTAVTGSSQIFIQYDESVSIPSVTCNVTPTARAARYLITSRSSGTSFTITAVGLQTTGNPSCLSYFIVN